MQGFLLNFPGCWFVQWRGLLSGEKNMLDAAETSFIAKCHFSQKPLAKGWRVSLTNFTQQTRKNSWLLDKRHDIMFNKRIMSCQELYTGFTPYVWKVHFWHLDTEREYKWEQAEFACVWHLLMLLGFWTQNSRPHSLFSPGGCTFIIQTESFQLSAKRRFWNLGRLLKFELLGVNLSVEWVWSVVLCCIVPVEKLFHKPARIQA